MAWAQQPLRIFPHVNRGISPFFPDLKLETMTDLSL